MADYSQSKPGVGAVYPVNAIDTAWNRLEPLVTPEQVRTRYLFGIPLISRFKDPVTGRPQIMTNDILQDYINRAVNIAEIETGLDIFPVQRDEKHAWDRNDYMSFGYFRTEHRPASSVDQLAVVPPNNDVIFIVPPEWIETARLAVGQINIIPLLVALTSAGGTIQATTAGAAVFLSMFSDRSFMPDFWRIRYTSGFPDGRLPTVINDLIGTICAMNILGMLAATYRLTSTSLGIDGMSQSNSGPGPQIYAIRLEQLADQRKMLVNKLKSMYGIKLFSGQV